MKRLLFGITVLSISGLSAVMYETARSVEASPPCMTSASMPYCLGSEPAIRMASDVPTVLTPLGSARPMTPVMIVGATGTSSPESAESANFMRAVSCETSSQELCVKEIVINGTNARLVPGYTGSCISQFATKYTLQGPAMGCTKSMDLDMKTQLPDYFVYFSRSKSGCRVDTQVLDCISQQVDIMPNPGLKNVPRITQLALSLQLPNSAFETQMGVAGSNGRITSFIPSVQNGNVMRIEITDPSRRFADYTGTSTSGRCGWWTPFIDRCTLASATTEISNDPKFFFYPAPLKNVRVEADGIVEPNPIGIGSYFSTDAQHVGLSSFNFETGAYGVTVAGPHESHLGGLNEAYLENYWPAAYVMDNFGITPAQANAVTLPVTRTFLGSNTALSTTYRATDQGLLLSSTGITFSTPTVSVRRVVSAAAGQMVRRTDIIAAAGLRTLPSPNQIVISTTKKDRKVASVSKSGVRFTRRGSYDILLNFKDANGKTSKRYVRVNVK